MIIGAHAIVYSKDPEADRDKFIDEYRRQFANPYRAAELGYIDEVIMPEETRPKIISALEMLATKRDTNPPKKHGNVPL